MSTMTLFEQVNGYFLTLLNCSNVNQIFVEKRPSNDNKNKHTTLFRKKHITQRKIHFKRALFSKK